MPRRKKPVVLEDEPLPTGSLDPTTRSPSRKTDRSRASANIEAFRAKYGEIHELTDESKLPQWVLHVLARKMFCDMTWADALREEFRTEARAKQKYKKLERYRKSPAFAAAREKMASKDADIRQMAADVIAGHAMKIGYLNLKVLKVAEETGNLPELAKQTRWLAENYGMTMPKKSDSAPTHISITLNGGTITAEIPSGESESTRLLPAEIIEDDA